MISHCAGELEYLSQVDRQGQGNAAYSLLLPGRILHLNALLAMKKFRDQENKKGAVRGFHVLQEAGLGKVIETRAQFGTSIVSAYMETQQVFIEMSFHGL